MFDLIDSMMKNAGFKIVGERCRTMVKHVGGGTIVVTASDGAELPEPDDFMVAAYGGDWLEDAEAPELYCATNEDLPEMCEDGLPAIDYALQRAEQHLRSQAQS